MTEEYRGYLILVERGITDKPYHHYHATITRISDKALVGFENGKDPTQALELAKAKIDSLEQS